MQARTRFFPFFLAYLVFLLYLCGMIGKRWIIGCWIAVMGGCLMACAPQAVREAEDVVAQADSLWHAGKQYGMDEGDSATLAQVSPLDATSSMSPIDISALPSSVLYIEIVANKQIIGAVPIPMNIQYHI